MKTPDVFTRYIESVCGHVRWKKARPVIADELECHMLDQRDAYLRCGMGPERAEALTVRSMGDSGLVGERYDAAYRPRTDWRLIGLALAINLAGLLAYFSPVTLRWMIGGDVSPLALTTVRFALASLIGWLCLTAAYFTDFTKLQRAAKYVFAGLAAMCAALWMVGDSGILYRFKYLGRHIPVLFPVLFAAVLCSERGGKGLARACCLLAVQVICCAMVGSATNVIICCGPSLVLLAAAIASGRFGEKQDVQWMTLGAALAICAGAFLILNRVIQPPPRLDGMYDGTAKTAIREILSHAKLIGHGGELGADVPVTPITTDMDHIVTRIIYNHGWLSLAAVAAAYTLFFVRGFRLCLRQNSTAGKFMSLAAVLTLFAEAALYITNDLGITSQAVSLPFFSFASILTVVFMAQLGVVLSANRIGGLVADIAV